MVKRKRVTRRRLRARRTRKRSMRRMKRGRQSLRMSRTAYITTWVPSTAAVANYWQYLQFSAGQIPDFATDFANTFDMYRINSVKVTFRPRYTEVDTSNATKGNATVHVIVDPKSRVVPAGLYTSTTVNTFLQNGKVRSYDGSRPFSVRLKHPCIIDDINATANATARRAPWLDTGATGFLHRGIHVFMTDASLSGNFGTSFDIFCTYNFSLKGYK